MTEPAPITALVPTSPQNLRLRNRFERFAQSRSSVPVISYSKSEIFTAGEDFLFFIV